MTDHIAKLKTPKDCAVFEINATERGRPDLALAARKRAVELRAIEHGATTDVERECLEAVFAYEQVLSAKNGKKTRASRTWPMIERHGILEAVERAVNRKEETVGYTALVEMGLEDYAFEAVILRHPSYFSASAVQRSQERINQHNGT
ncbi:hypothetical protein [Rheinheimera sp. 4Y26]|uniref:hypothetical protein n=1 Tax=Rheinheimera sp. 4Y26 TaxID=2977811 RepID=UPI0021B08F4F|nr:hypothetical protein [Rheinheimera sp. 4Y26]MCT6699995.1 hypothetical protein [Rheinheimera sp. 4Y26]